MQYTIQVKTQRGTDAAPMSEWPESTAHIECTGDAYDARDAYIRKRTADSTAPFVVIDCYPTPHSEYSDVRCAHGLWYGLPCEDCINK